MLNFDDYALLIINRLEGGYFHPDMYTAHPEFFSYRNGVYNETLAKAYSQSGETMLGQDRAKGGNFAEFWAVVDQYYTPYHANLDYWLEKGGKLRTGKKSAIPAEVTTKLIKLLIPQKKALFNTFLNRYIIDAKEKELIQSDPKLFLQFAYGVWNGEGRFQRYANVFNTAWAHGTKDANKLNDLVQAERLAIFGRANEIMSVTFPKLLKEVEGNGTSTTSNYNWIWLLAGAAAIFFIFKRK